MTGDSSAVSDMAAVVAAEAAVAVEEDKTPPLKWRSMGMSCRIEHNRRSSNFLGTGLVVGVMRCPLRSVVAGKYCNVGC